MSRKSASNDSLDLLLDTICNTFGGVLFTSLLVVVLLNISGKTAASVPAPQTATSQLTAAQQELANTMAEYQRIKEIYKIQSEASSRIANPDVLKLISEMTKVEASLGGTVERRKDQVDKTAKTQVQINQIADALQALDQAMESAQQSLAKVERELEKERTLRSRTVELPREHDAGNKGEAAFLLKGGRLYGYMRLSNSGQFERNTQDTTTKIVDGYEVLEPVAGGGTVITLTGDVYGPIATKLTGLSGQHHFVAVFVYEDSYAHFAALRQFLVSKGIEYSLLPLAPGELAVISDNVETHVQ